MDQEMTTSKWIKFFMEAGIPASSAAHYALLFCDNRIQRDMLLDLNKDILMEMGIRPIGDIIAIMKHAKVTYPQAVNDKLTAAVTRSPASQRTPTIRLLGPSAPNPLPSEMETSFNSGIYQMTSSEGLKRKREVFPPSIPPAKRSFRSLNSTEDEGCYSIKMPEGTTPKTQRILQQQHLQTKGKKSVFDRLGESVVSSTTDAVSTKFKKSSSTISGIFSRLGEVEERAPSPLKYQGVLKKTVGIPLASSNNSPVQITRVISKPLNELVKIPQTKTRNETVFQVRKPSTVQRRQLTKATPTQKLSRQKNAATGLLLLQRTLSDINRQSPRAASQKVAVQRSNIKQRLGLKPSSGNVQTTTKTKARTTLTGIPYPSKSVFDRLGTKKIQKSI